MSQTTTTAPAADAIHMTIDIAASPERVFAALLDPAHLNAWWQGETTGAWSRWEVDAREGGRWTARGWDTSCGDWTCQGTIRTLLAPRVLEYTWEESIASAPGRLLPTLVRYELEATPSGTRVHLTHGGFGDNHPVQAEYTNGWPGVMRLLARYLER